MMNDKLGIELEMQLIDSNTLDLVDKVDLLMHDLGQDANIDTEVFQSCIEIKTSPQNGIAEASEELLDRLAKVHTLAKSLGIDLCSLAVHPFSRRISQITQKQRYIDFEQEYPYLTRHQLTFSTHIHVSMKSLHESVIVMNRLRSLCPLFIALSASSPYWEGEETGFVSFRHYFLDKGLNGGMPPYFSDSAEFRQFVNGATNCGSIKNLKDIHWDIRPRPDLGTLEFRIMDAVPTISEAMELCSLAYETTIALKTNEIYDLLPDTFTERLHPWIDELNHAQACHRGLEGLFIINNNGKTSLIKDICQKLMKRLNVRISKPAPYIRLKHVYNKTYSFKRVMKFAIDELSEELKKGPLSRAA
jgi:glutamate---cysteine ligase / carboxylate-amine ligase